MANQTERFPEDRKNEEMKMAEMLPVQKHQVTLIYVPDRDPPYQVGLLWKKDPDYTLGNNSFSFSQMMVLKCAFHFLLSHDGSPHLSFFVYSEYCKIKDKTVGFYGWYFPPF